MTALERCENCGSTQSLAEIQSAGFRSCCPERRMSPLGSEGAHPSVGQRPSAGNEGEAGVLRDAIDNGAKETPRSGGEAEELKRLREALTQIAGHAWSEGPDHGAYDEEPPPWAQDTFNSDCASSCGYCGSWMAVVRPGKVQCDTCSDGRDLGALARAALSKALGADHER